MVRNVGGERACGDKNILCEEDDDMKTVKRQLSPMFAVRAWKWLGVSELDTFVHAQHKCRVVYYGMTI